MLDQHVNETHIKDLDEAVDAIAKGPKFKKVVCFDVFMDDLLDDLRVSEPK